MLFFLCEVKIVIPLADRWLICLFQIHLINFYMWLQTEFTNMAKTRLIFRTILHFNLFKLLPSSLCAPCWLLWFPAYVPLADLLKNWHIFRFWFISFNFSQLLRLLQAPDATSLLLFRHSFVPFQQEFTEKHHKDFRIPPILHFKSFTALKNHHKLCLIRRKFNLKKMTKTWMWTKPF